MQPILIRRRRLGRVIARWSSLKPTDYTITRGKRAAAVCQFALKFGSSDDHGHLRAPRITSAAIKPMAEGFSSSSPTDR